MRVVLNKEVVRDLRIGSGVLLFLVSPIREMYVEELRERLRGVGIVLSHNDAVKVIQKSPVSFKSGGRVFRLERRHSADFNLVRIA